MRLTGAVLAGGGSSRMKTDKALLEIRGVPFVQRVAEVLSVACESVVIIGNGPERFEGLRYQVFEDVLPDCGPLGGIHSALVHTKNDHVFVAACDLPLISKEVVYTIVQRRSSGREISYAKHGSATQPLLGIYSTACVPALEKYLKKGERTVLDFLNQQSVETIDLGTSEYEISQNVLMNINTAEEYERISGRGTGTRGE